MPAFRSLFFCAAIAAIAVPCAAQTYRWVDKTGKTVFSDKAPPPEIKAFEKTDKHAPEGDQQTSYALQQAAEKYPVTLYTTANCKESCVSARALLNGRGIPFSEKLISTPEEYAEAAKVMGSESFVPGLRVGSQKFSGFEAGSWNNLLDLAGYPKTAPYGSKPSGVFSK